LEVFHAPVFILQANTIGRISLRLPEHFRFVFWLFALLGGIAATFGAALPSWNLVEKHCLRLKRLFVVKGVSSPA
jgi:peptidoglycan/LPS O-acetylase OafA/YrhL